MNVNERKKKGESKYCILIEKFMGIEKRKIGSSSYNINEI